MNTTHDELLLEMKTLVIRYGTDEVQKAFDSVKVALAPKVLRKKSTSCVTLCVPCEGNGKCKSFWHLLRSSLCHPTNVKLRFHVKCERLYYRTLEDIAALMEECYDSISFQQQQQLLLQRPIDPMTNIQRVESSFDTLYFTHNQSSLVQRKKCFALFKTVVLQYFYLHDESSDVKGCDFFDHFMEMVLNDGLISSLKFEYCAFEPKQAVQVTGVLEANVLEAIEFSDVELDIQLDTQVSPFTQVWTQSLRKHIEMFAQASKLKVLKLNDVWKGMTFDHYRELFHVIGSLPNLQLVSIHAHSEDLYNALCESLGSWSIRQFIFVCGHTMPQTIELRSLFDAVGSARNLKVFDFQDFLSERIAGQVFDLAVSPMSGLLEIFLRGSLDLRLLSLVVPAEGDPTIAVGPQLRRFNFVEETSQIDEILEDGDDARFESNVQALLRLFSKQLPFLHSIGSAFDDWIDDRENYILPEFPFVRNLWNQMLVQIEKNRVGMALFEAAALPLSTVPEGLWSVVVHRAIIYDEDARKLPWTGIYLLVRQLFERGHAGLFEVDKKRRVREDGIPDDNDRPKRDGAKVA